MWATLHSGTLTANTSLTATSTYATTGLNELADSPGAPSTGYTHATTGASTNNDLGTITLTNGASSVLDVADKVWTTGASETLTAGHAAFWINDSQQIVGASLVCVSDSSQTASNGGTLTATMTNTITIPTPA